MTLCGATLGWMRDGGFKINEAGVASRNTGHRLLSDSHRMHDRPFSQSVSPSMPPSTEKGLCNQHSP